MKKYISLPAILLILGLSFLQIHCGETNAKSKEDGSANKQTEEKTSSDSPDKKKKDEAVPVEVTTAKAGDISSYILLSSNLETEKMADVYSRVQGIVEKLYAEEGDHVRKGQSLVSLEAEEHELNEQSARVSFDQQKNAYERAQSMFDKKLLSKEEFEQAKFTMENARIEWEKAQLNLKYTQIEAPISGVVGERLVRPGDRIQPSDKLFSVINTTEMIAVVHAPEKEIGRIRKNQQAFLTSDNLGGKKFTGWIKRVSPVVDPQSGTFKVTIGVKNRKGQLRPGMFVNTHIITETHKDAVLIPKTALVYNNEKKFVFVVRDGIASKVLLNVGFQDYRNIEALSDVDAGDKIILVGQAGLKDQSKVKIVSER